MYCYKCGVKLRENEKRCPLCHTYLKYAKDSDELAAYSNIIDDVGKHVDFKYLSRVLLFVLLLVTLITVICDYCISGKVTWSVYVIVSTIYLAAQVSFLYFEKKLVPAVLNLLGLECLLFTIAFFADGLHWYLYLVMPNVFAVWLLIVLSVYIFKRKKRNLMRNVPIILFVISSILVVTEILIDLYIRRQIELVWSLYASIPIVVLGLIILIASFNKKLVDEIKKRLFI
jgi:hypothetical protein